jgi:hypothetical protein
VDDAAVNMWWSLPLGHVRVEGGVGRRLARVEGQPRHSPRGGLQGTVLTPNIMPPRLVTSPDACSAPRPGITDGHHQGTHNQMMTKRTLLAGHGRRHVLDGVQGLQEALQHRGRVTCTHSARRITHQVWTLVR